MKLSVPAVVVALAASALAGGSMLQKNPDDISNNDNNNNNNNNNNNADSSIFQHDNEQFRREATGACERLKLDPQACSTAVLALCQRVLSDAGVVAKGGVQAALSTCIDNLKPAQVTSLADCGSQGLNQAMCLTGLGLCKDGLTAGEKDGKFKEALLTQSCFMGEPGSGAAHPNPGMVVFQALKQKCPSPDLKEQWKHVSCVKFFTQKCVNKKNMAQNVDNARPSQVSPHFASCLRDQDPMSNEFCEVAGVKDCQSKRDTCVNRYRDLAGRVEMYSEIAGCIKESARPPNVDAGGSVGDGDGQQETTSTSTEEGNMSEERLSRGVAKICPEFKSNSNPLVDWASTTVTCEDYLNLACRFQPRVIAALSPSVSEDDTVTLDNALRYCWKSPGETKFSAYCQGSKYQGDEEKCRQAVHGCKKWGPELPEGTTTNDIKHFLQTRECVIKKSPQAHSPSSEEETRLPQLSDETFCKSTKLPKEDCESALRSCRTLLNTDQVHLLPITDVFLQACATHDQGLEEQPLREAVCKAMPGVSGALTVNDCLNKVEPCQRKIKKPDSIIDFVNYREKLETCALNARCDLFSNPGGEVCYLAVSECLGDFSSKKEKKSFQSKLKCVDDEMKKSTEADVDSRKTITDINKVPPIDKDLTKNKLYCEVFLQYEGLPEVIAFNNQFQTSPVPQSEEEELSGAELQKHVIPLNDGNQVQASA